MIRFDVAPLWSYDDVFSVVQLLYLFLSLRLSSTAKRNQLDLTFA